MKTITKVILALHTFVALWLGYWFLDTYFFYHSWSLHPSYMGPLFLTMGIILLLLIVINILLVRKTKKRKNKIVLVYSIITLLIMIVFPFPPHSYFLESLSSPLTAKGRWIESGSKGYKGTCPDGYKWPSGPLILDDGTIVQVDTRTCIR